MLLELGFRKEAAINFGTAIKTISTRLRGMGATGREIARLEGEVANITQKYVPLQTAAKATGAIAGGLGGAKAGLTGVRAAVENIGGSLVPNIALKYKPIAAGSAGLGAGVGAGMGAATAGTLVKGIQKLHTAGRTRKIRKLTRELSR